MKRIRVSRASTRRELLYLEDLPADPRDPDVVRAKALARAQSASSSRSINRAQLEKSWVSQTVPELSR